VKVATTAAAATSMITSAMAITPVVIVRHCSFEKNGQWVMWIEMRW
jgi:hypothetical protein